MACTWRPHSSAMRLTTAGADEPSARPDMRTGYEVATGWPILATALQIIVSTNRPVAVCRATTQLSPTAVDKHIDALAVNPGRLCVLDGLRRKNFFSSTGCVLHLPLSQAELEIRADVIPSSVRSRCTTGERVSTRVFWLSTPPVDNELSGTTRWGVTYVCAGPAADSSSGHQPGRSAVMSVPTSTVVTGDWTLGPTGHWVADVRAIRPLVRFVRHGGWPADGMAGR